MAAGPPPRSQALLGNNPLAPCCHSLLHRSPSGTTNTRHSLTPALHSCDLHSPKAPEAPSGETQWFLLIWPSWPPAGFAQGHCLSSPEKTLAYPSGHSFYLLLLLRAPGRCCFSRALSAALLPPPTHPPLLLCHQNNQYPPPFPGLCSLPLLLPLPRRPQSRLPFMCSHSLWNCQVCGNSRPACVIDLWRLFPLPDSSQPGPGGHHSVWGLAPSHVSAETLLRGPHLSPLLWALPALSSSPTDMHSQPCTSSCCPQLAPNGLLICPFKSCTSS